VKRKTTTFFSSNDEYEGGENFEKGMRERELRQRRRSAEAVGSRRSQLSFFGNEKGNGGLIVKRPDNYNYKFQIEMDSLLGRVGLIRLNHQKFFINGSDPKIM
jgi:hypothetical protein